MNRPRGFTLIELMVVLGIIAILAAIAIPSYTEYVRRSRITEAISSLSGMRVKMEQYYQDNRTYVGACQLAPPSIANLPPPTPNWVFACPGPTALAYVMTATGVPGSVVDGITYTMDQQNNRTTVIAAPSTWLGNGSACWVLKKDGSC